MARKTFEQICREQEESIAYQEWIQDNVSVTFNEEDLKELGLLS